jgi:radical SAM protein with 4Fe4S-binding SPASM domain
MIMKLVLSPEVKLRKDGGRAILFSVNALDNESVFKFLYPQHAVILALFDGNHNLKEITESVAYLFDIDEKTASQKVKALLDLPVTKDKTIRSYIVDVSTADPEKIRSYDPRDFIVRADTIDMTNKRCNIPCSLIVLPTMRCYTNCIYCYADRKGMQKQDEFNLQFYKRLLDEAKECGIETVGISGGDFFCREDAFDLIRCTLEKGMYLTIPTKYPLSRDRVNQLAEIGLSTIQISIDALSPDIIDKLVERHGYGEEILKTLDYLGEAGIHVRTNTVLTPYNIKDAIHLARHLAKMPHTFGCKFTAYGRSLYNHRSDLFCSPSDLEEFKRELDQIRSEFPHKFLSLSRTYSNPYKEDKDERSSAFWKRPTCTANQQAAIVLPNGQVTICEELYFHKYFIIGDLRKQSLVEAWNSPKALEIAHPDQSLIPEGPCRDCPDFSRCRQGRGVCFRDTLKAYGYDKPYWPDPRCPRAPVGNRLV